MQWTLNQPLPALLLTADTLSSCICVLVLFIVSFYTGALSFCVEGLGLIYQCNAWNIIDTQIFVGQMKINPQQYVDGGLLFCVLYFLS